MKSLLAFFMRFIGLSVWHFLSLMIAALIINHFASLADPGVQPPNIAVLFLISLIETAAVVWMVLNLRLSGVRLLLAVIVIFHGVKTALMMIELVFFLHFWAASPLITLERVFALELHGLLMACLYCPIVILVLKRWGNQQPTNVQGSLALLLSVKILGVSLLYWLCYWVAGAFILIPLAGDSFGFTYGQLQVPQWLWLFQMGRGFLWALIVYLLVLYLKDRGAKLYVQVGLILSALSAAQLLSSSPYMLDGLRYAHIVEIVSSMLVFGILAAWILRPTISIPHTN